MTTIKRQPKLTEKKRAEMKAAFLERPLDQHVAKVCRVSRITAAKYRAQDGWDAALDALNAKVEAALINRLTEKRIRKITFLDWLLKQMEVNARKDGSAATAFGVDKYDRSTRLHEFLERGAVESEENIQAAIERALATKSNDELDAIIANDSRDD